MPSEYNTSDEPSRDQETLGEQPQPSTFIPASPSIPRQFSRQQSHCCHTIAASQLLYDLKKENAVRQRVVTRTAVRAPVAEVKNERKLPRTSSIRLVMKKEAALIRTQSLKKVTGVLGDTQGHEEQTVPRVQRGVLWFRIARKTAIGVHEDCDNSLMFMGNSYVAKVSRSFVRFSSQSLQEFMEWANTMESDS